MFSLERRAPLASLEDFSSIHYASPRFTKKLSDFASPLITKSDSEGTGLVENSENVKNFVKYNANRKMRPLVKVPKDRL